VVPKNALISFTGGYLIDGDSDEALKLVSGAIKSAGLDGKVGIILDCAGNDFGDKDYHYEITKFSTGKPKQVIGGAQLVEKYVNWVQTYPGIIAFCDPMHYQDLGYQAELFSKLKKVQIIGAQQFNSRADRVKYMSETGRGQLSHGVCVELC